MKPKPTLPAEPVERRPIGFDFESKVLQRGKEKGASQFPAWKARWLQDQELDDDLRAEALSDGAREGIIKEIQEEAGRRLDIVYTWVNGSDAALKEVKEKFKETSELFLYFKNITRQKTNSPRLPPLRAHNNRREDVGFGHAPPVVGNGKGDQTVHRFRDNNELKYSLRSIAEYIPAKMLGRIHILTTEVPDNQTEGGLVGQVPKWLDLEMVEKGGGKVRLVKHREIYDNTSVLPSFNSLSIESQMHHVPDLADTFIYMNDDFFYGLPVDTSDFWTPLYGFVFHLTGGIIEPVIPILGSSPNVGEWQSLQYTNYLLSKQFGARHRAYLSHIIHIMNKPILDEIQSIWPEEFDKTASHRFRGEGQAQEINLAFFMAHYVMERLRETHLTSYWKYRLDRNQDGWLDWEEREVLIRMVEEYDETLSKVANRRAMMPFPTDMVFNSFLQERYDNKLENVGIPWTGQTRYEQSGMDGYPFMMIDADLSRSSSNQFSWQPYSTKTDPDRRRCQFDFDFCLGPQFRNKSAPAVDSSTGKGSAFERLAFTEYHCGDCLLHIVRRRSTLPGMGSVMPLQDQDPEAFSKVAQDMAKYNYVIGRSQFTFMQLTTGDKSEAGLKRLLEKNQTETYFCVNDDVPDSPLIAKRVERLFAMFLETRLPNPSPWEKDVEDA
ncbi:Xanthine phosphoribosyltransferase 1 [Linnemannia gamsii]|uniref:Xanthine phosphoribosyltransferase 1 n=1 Tax=Linnemannia gamsii TaxID=64522 RepID=A0ABQ7JLK4_9FUNG|nr:Xanthine phosphoribosyltransferase 1 [Linnemannia gamsii]